MQKVDLSFRGMDIHVNPMRFNLQTQIDEWMTSFGKESGIHLLHCLFNGTRLYSSMIDEKDKRGLFHAIIGIADPTLRLKAPSITVYFEINELMCNGTPVDLAYSIKSGGICRD